MSDLQVIQKLSASYLIGAGSDLLLASSTTLSAEERLFYGARAWTAWASACAAMAELETVMPRSAAAGYDMRDRLQAFRERQTDRQEIAR